MVGDGITQIGVNLFSNLMYLEKVDLPESLQVIENSAFYNTHRLHTILLPASLTEIWGSAFYGSGLTEITIPDGISSLQTGTFEYCTSLRTVRLPASVREIRDGAFHATDIRTVLYAGSAEDWENIAVSSFRDQNAPLLNAELYCMPEPDLTLPAGLARLEEEAFRGAAFTCVRLPADLLSVGRSVFADCAGLRCVYVPGADTALNAAAFGDDPAALQRLTVYGPAGSLAETWCGETGCRFYALF